MYKTAVICDEISQDLTVAAGLAARYGLNGLEIRSVNERNPFQMTKEDFRFVRQVCDDHGLAICAVGSPLFKCRLDSETEYRQHLDGLARCIEAAHAWGTDIIRGFTFWKNGEGEACFPRIADRYARAIDLARDGGITIVIESEPSVCTENMAMLHTFLTQLGSDRVAALFDPGNEVSDPACPPPYPDGYELLKPYIRHVHLKDAKSTTGRDFYEPALMGRGDVDFHGLLRRLKADGYDGWVSIETHYRMKRAAFSESELATPQGSGFSDGGYEATQAYLDILRDEYDWMGEVK